MVNSTVNLFIILCESYPDLVVFILRKSKTIFASVHFASVRALVLGWAVQLQKYCSGVLQRGSAVSIRRHGPLITRTERCEHIFPSILFDSPLVDVAQRRARAHIQSLDDEHKELRRSREMDAPQPCPPQMNTDVSGIGVRISFYLQALFLCASSPRIRGRAY